MLLNALFIALREIRRNVIRSFLTVVGVVIGVAAVISMVSLGNGATAVVKQNISKMGNNLMTLRPGQGWGGGAGIPLFELADVDAIRDQVPGVDTVAPFVQTNVSAVFQENDRKTDIQGTTPDYFRVANWELAMGRFFTDEEVMEGAQVAVIGETIRKEVIGEGIDPIGCKIRLKSTTVTVIGVTTAKGQGGMSDDLDDNIIVPYTSIQRRLTGRGSNGRNINQIMIAGIDGYPSANVVADVTLLMRERRSLGENEENNFSIFDSQQLTEIVTASTKVMTQLLGWVAGVSLIVGGIGIMNIMLVSVTERTREIGIRLAIGARAREVLWQFLVEAVTLSCVGGICGIALAYAACYYGADLVGAPFQFDPKINIIAFVFSAGIGILFGFMPARRAAALDPIEALRHE
ncbi:MAG: ABC transporter permease [Verrucomicrobia bacterium]|nr:ABC transporter permease [Verrucomicrobiota bacterium]